MCSLQIKFRTLTAANVYTKAQVDFSGFILATEAVANKRTKHRLVFQVWFL
jgi:hypothetical protein